ANALRNLGLETHVVEMAPRLMPVQVDEIGGEILRPRVEALGVGVPVGMSAKRVVVGASGRVVALQFADGGELPTELVVFSAGIRPRDGVGRGGGPPLRRAAGARAAAPPPAPARGLEVDPRCRTSDPAILAIGECASWYGQTYGLVAPGYKMADVAVGTLTGAGDAQLGHFDMSTKLKLLGVDVASFGDAFALEAGAHTLSI